MKFFLLICYLFFLSCADATEVNLSLLPGGGEAQLEVINVSYDELDIFSLKIPIEKSGGRDLKLLCSFNPFYESLQSTVVFTHDSIYRGIRFSMDENSCLKFFNFLKGNFEIVNHENPILITLDLDSMEVKSIGWKENSFGNKPTKVTLFH